jgi:acetyl-CoA carboxylase biotin carboxyl carrier protein
VINAKDVSEIVKALSDAGFEDAEVRLGDLHIRVSSQPLRAVVSQDIPEGESARGVRAPAPDSASAPSSLPALAQEDLTVIRAPTLGTFYRAASPGAAPFVNVGDRIDLGQAIGIVEVMKLFNTIEADAPGVVVEIHVADATLVEYDQPLMTLRMD